MNIEIDVDEEQQKIDDHNNELRIQECARLIDQGINQLPHGSKFSIRINRTSRFDGTANLIINGEKSKKIYVSPVLDEIDYRDGYIKDLEDKIGRLEHLIRVMK